MEGMLLREHPCRTSPGRTQLTGSDRPQAIRLAMILAEGTGIRIRRVSAPLASTLTAGIRLVRARTLRA